MPPCHRAGLHPAGAADAVLYARCECGGIRQHPINLTLIEKPKAERWTLADSVVRFGCTQCSGRMASVVLVENHRLPACSGVAGGPDPGWALLLHEAG